MPATLLDKDGVEYVAYMLGYVAETRSIPGTMSPEHTIYRTLRKPCKDIRIRIADPMGSSLDEATASHGCGSGTI